MMYTLHLKKQLHAANGSMLLEVRLNIEKGSFISLYGKSGAGKTTLLKMLAGLVTPDEGAIRTQDEVWFDKAQRINTIPQKRKIGFVFQDYALFPNMTVKENLEFVIPNKSDKTYVKEVMNMMELTGLSNRHPAELSGGQQQRVALARALVRQPELLLLDEPLSALDSEMRTKLQDEIARLHKHFGLTTVLISHEPAELYRLSDRIIEIEQGRVVKDGKADEIFHHRGITGKVQLIGEVLDVTPNDMVFIVKVVSGNQIIKVVITRQQAAELKPGDKVLVSSKAFNPVVMKID